MKADPPISLPDLAETLTDACGLLDQVVEHLATHRHLSVDDRARTVELHAVEDFTAQGWAHARQARTLLDDLLNPQETK